MTEKESINPDRGGALLAQKLTFLGVFREVPMKSKRTSAKNNSFNMTI